jgi:hypothetical protein
MPDGSTLPIIHPNLKLLSHSSVVLLHKCPRKYELYKLLPSAADDDDVHTAWGDIVGQGVQEYLIGRDFDKAAFKMFCAWKKGIDDEDGARDKKTFWFALEAVSRFVGYRNSLLGRYELAYFDGKPAVELGFSIDLGDGFYYRGFLDALLIDKMRKELLVYEGKTTKFQKVHEATYKHSSQSLGYSLVVDAIAEALGANMDSSFKVHYAIYKSGDMEWLPMPFVKSHTDRALWIRNLVNDKARVIEYARNGFFPMHGESCFDFFRPCPHFGTCESKYLVDMDEVKTKVERPEKYTFNYTIEELIEVQLKKHSLQAATTS